jgi:hypothetical protein
MKHDNPLLNDGAVEHPGDSFLPFDAQFEKTLAQCTRMRHAKVWAEFDHEIRKTEEPCKQAGREMQYQFLNARVEILDAPCHGVKITYLLLDSLFNVPAGLDPAHATTTKTGIEPRLNKAVILSV